MKAQATGNPTHGRREFLTATLLGLAGGVPAIATATEASLPAAIRNIVALARLAVETYEKRSEVVTGSK